MQNSCDISSALATMIMVNYCILSSLYVLISIIYNNYILSRRCKCSSWLWSFCNHLIMINVMARMLCFIFQIAKWSLIFVSNASCTSESRKRKYLQGDEKSVAKGRNKRRQHFLMTLEMQLVSACCYSCSITILSYFVLSGK